MAAAMPSFTSRCCSPPVTNSVAPETKLRVTVGQGQKGRQVKSVLEVDASTAQAQRPARPMGGAIASTAAIVAVIAVVIVATAEIAAGHACATTVPIPARPSRWAAP